MLLLLFSQRVVAQVPEESKVERRPWTSAGFALSVPVVRDLQSERRTPVKLMPAGLISWVLGAAWGPTALAARLDAGFGGVRAQHKDPERGIGYVLSLGPVFRTQLYQGAVGVAVLAETTLLHVGTAAQEACSDPCTTDVESYPQLGVQALAPGAAIQLTFLRKHLLFELRYQRPYWFHLADEASLPSVHAWDFMPTDQWTVSVGGWFDGR